MTCYTILGIPENADADRIKSAYRELSLLYHPDGAGNTPEAHTRFILISHAYKELIDPEKRKIYDDFLRKSSVLRNMRQEAPGSSRGDALPGRRRETYLPTKALLDYLNYVLWEIEDILDIRRGLDLSRRFGGRTVRYYILHILTFIDK